MKTGKKYLLKTWDENGTLNEADSWLSATFDGVHLIGEKGENLDAWLDGDEVMEED